MERNLKETMGDNTSNNQRIVAVDVGVEPEINYRGIRAMPYIIG